MDYTHTDNIHVFNALLIFHFLRVFPVLLLCVHIFCRRLFVEAAKDLDAAKFRDRERLSLDCKQKCGRFCICIFRRFVLDRTLLPPIFCASYQVPHRFFLE